MAWSAKVKTRILATCHITIPNILVDDHDSAALQIFSILACSIDTDHRPIEKDHHDNCDKFDKAKQQTNAEQVRRFEMAE
jgi:hypothetical protein